MFLFRRDVFVAFHRMNVSNINIVCKWNCTNRKMNESMANEFFKRNNWKVAIKNGDRNLCMQTHFNQANCMRSDALDSMNNNHFIPSCQCNKNTLLKNFNSNKNSLSMCAFLSLSFAFLCVCMKLKSNWAADTCNFWAVCISTCNSRTFSYPTLNWSLLMVRCLFF